jgi:hypothetical protein
MQQDDLSIVTAQTENRTPPAAQSVVAVLNAQLHYQTHSQLRLVAPGHNILYHGRLYRVQAGTDGDPPRLLVENGIVVSSVDSTYKRYARMLIDLSISGANGQTNTICGTPEHPFYVLSHEEFIEISRLPVGTALKTDDGREATVADGKIVNKSATVYNLNIAQAHNYFVTSQIDGIRILVHNANYPLGFVEEAIEAGNNSGFRPSVDQRPVNFDTVQQWAEKVRDPNFVWKTAAEMGPEEHIIVAPDGEGGYTILAGQHRILGGIMGGKPVPMSSMTVLSTPMPSRSW